VSPLPILDTLPTEGVTTFTGHWYIEDSMASVKKINKVMLQTHAEIETSKHIFKPKKQK